MNDDHEVDWGNDEDDTMLSPSYFDSVGMDHTSGGVETDDVEDAVSLGGDEEEEFAAYGARSNEQNTPSADKFQTTHLKRDARRRSASVGRTPRKEMSQVQPAPLPPSPQPETRQLTLTHALPPKPVVSSSIRPPPSTTAASPMSLPRKERRSNGSTTKKSDDASLSDKETKSSRTAGRESHHRDSNADESSWTRPGSNATDSQPPHRDRARSVNDRDGYPSLRREDDCYRPSYHPVYYSSDEEGREPDTCRTQPRHDARYRYDDRDRHYDYASDDRVDRPSARSARHSPDGVSLDRSRPIYRESIESDSRRAHPRDRDASPIRDDSSRRGLRRDDYPVYDSFDKSSRDYGDSSRRSSGTAERSRYPESFSGRSNSVVLRDHHTQNQGPGRSSTLRRNSPSPRPRSRSPPYNGRDDRRHSPPRYQEYLSNTRHSYRGRAESPPQRFREPNKLDRRDTPPDLPQRRPRGISDVHDPDYAPKRRKMDDDDGNLPPVRRGPVGVGVDTYIPLETSTASTSPRSTGALDDLSRQRRREPLPPQSHRYREASDLTSRPPLSGSNRIMPQPQLSAHSSHRHYRPSSKDKEVFPSRHSDPDLSRLDRSRNSGHGPGYVYVDKFSRDDHMKVDSPYPSRGPYEEPVRHQDSTNRTSLHNDAISRGHIPPSPLPRSRETMNAVPATPIVLASTIAEKPHRRSRDRSPRHHHEPRQMSNQPSSTSLSTTQTRPPQDMQLVEDRRRRGRRIDSDREDHSPTLARHPSSPVAVRSRSTGRYDVPDGGPRPLRSPELHATPSIQEQPRHSRSNSRRERQAPPVAETSDIPPPRVSGDSIPIHGPPQERAGRSGPPPDTDFPPPSPSSPVSPLTREWIPRQPEFMSNLPPPSTRLPGAPPPPLMPPQPYSTPRDPLLQPGLSQNENTSANLENESGREPSQEIYKHKPSSPVRQTKDILPPPSYQTQEGRHEQMPRKYIDGTSRVPAHDGLKENSGEERFIPTSPEDSRTKVTSETIPASWDRPRDNAPLPARKPLTLPPSLPPKPVAALGDLNLQSSSSSRAGHSSRGRRGQQQSTDESNSNSTRWGRGDGGRDKDREGNRWGPTSEYPGPSLLARMSNDPPGRDMTERVGETHRKRARRRYQGS